MNFITKYNQVGKFPSFDYVILDMQYKFMHFIRDVFGFKLGIRKISYFRDMRCRTSAVRYIKISICDTG